MSFKARGDWLRVFFICGRRSLRVFFGEAELDGGAGKFAECVGGDPAGGGRIETTDLLGGADGGTVERGIAFADVAECPVHGFFYEVAIVEGFAFDDLE